MRFIKVSSTNFRNLELSSEINVDHKKVLLIGDNGQGKTNFLELLYLLCYGNSFRTSNLRDIVNFKEKSFYISGIFEDERGLKRNISFIFKNGTRVIKIDNKQITDRKELIYNIPCIVFSHSDLDFVNGQPESRRKFFNQTLSMYDSLFFDDFRYYSKIVKQKNMALKESSLELLPIYDQLLSQYGLNIMRARIKAVYEMNQIFPELYEKVSGIKNVKIKYKPSWKNCSTEEDIQKILEKNRDRDLILKFNTTGISRDKFLIEGDNGDLSTSGSTGQLRLASLVLRATQSQFYKKKTGKDPVLLVDDVLLELDIKKRSTFLSLLDGYSQAFFTFLPKEQYFNDDSEDTDKMVLTVCDGGFI
ncbi:MAG: DNA replication/repair protein RecF [Spirochaetaceae bacterium]|nr:DNA replication/repair protein RecF [Spirochaetaceae bacterium]